MQGKYNSDIKSLDRVLSAMVKVISQSNLDTGKRNVLIEKAPFQSKPVLIDCRGCFSFPYVHDMVFLSLVVGKQRIGRVWHQSIKCSLINMTS